MDKKKMEQVMLIILIPVFLGGLLYMRSRTETGLGAKTNVEEVSQIAEDPQLDKLPEPQGILDAKYEASKNDPLKDLLALYIYKLQREGEKGASDKEMPLPPMTIEGLIWNTDMPQAIVNGRVVKVGDTIEGVKVVSIDKKGITVLHEGQPVAVSKK